MLDATAFPEPGTPFAYPPRPESYLREMQVPPGRLRVAFSSETPSGRAIDPEVRRALEDTAQLLVELGHDVEERGLGVDYRALYRAHGALGASGAAAGIREAAERLGREPREEELEPLTWAGIRSGRKLSGEVVMRALRDLRRLVREVLLFFESHDLYLTPVMGTPPPRVGHIDPVALEPRELGKRQSVAFPFTPPFNFTGQPAMSVPLAWSASGLPIGMQLAARFGDETTLIRVAAQLEAARPWRAKKPPIFG
jgi:amidase